MTSGTRKVLTVARRTRLTRPYPVNTLEEVLPIAEIIQSASGGHPVPTELLAESLGTTLKSSAFVQRLGSSARYGITIGSHTSEQISLTPLGESLTAPRDPVEKADALRTAARQPEVFRKFYDIHAGKQFPEIPYASNTLVREMGIKQELTEECLRVIRVNGLLTGIVSEKAGSLIVEAYGTRQDGYESDVLDPSGGYDSPVTENAQREADSFVLVLSVGGDTAAKEVEGLIETLSVPVRAEEIDLQASQVISSSVSTGLRSARGCVLVWPGDELTEGPQQLLAKTWMIIGAASFQLGNRVIVVSGGHDQTEMTETADSLDIMVVDRFVDGGMFRDLMTAMVQTSIVQVSLG